MHVQYLATMAGHSQELIMWQSPTPVCNFFQRELTGPDAWAYLFAQAWEMLELDPEDLNMEGLEGFGHVVAEKHGDEDPAVVAARLYPECGEFHDQVYPAFTIAPMPATPPPLPIVEGDVPF